MYAQKENKKIISSTDTFNHFWQHSLSSNVTIARMRLKSQMNLQGVKRNVK